MNKVKLLLERIINDDPINQDKWMNGYNHAFGMSPQEMIDQGREEEVIDYLVYQIVGPY